MVIQRWQTLLLILAIVCTAISLATPIGYVGEAAICATSNLTCFIIGVATAILLLVDMFLFRNLGLQIKVAKIAILLQAVITVSTIVMGYFEDGFSMSSYNAPLMLVSIVCTWFAICLMKKDRKLLADANRLR